jgi:hypothetical protein
MHEVAALLSLSIVPAEQLKFEQLEKEPAGV